MELSFQQDFASARVSKKNIQKDDDCPGDVS